jgi:glycerol-3-phosphate dehydrogenase subunit B
MTELLIVGAGLTGLFAAALAGRRGAAVTLICQGRGGLGIGHGCIDVWSAGVLERALPHLADNHPYRRAGLPSLRSALTELDGMLNTSGLRLSGSLARNLQLPTPAGQLRPSAFALIAQAQADPLTGEDFALATIDAFRDFALTLASDNLRRLGAPPASLLELPMVGLPTRRDAYATDLARCLDDPPLRAETLRAWKPRVLGIRRLGLPAVLGLRSHPVVMAELEDKLGLQVFEIATLPPSVPGLRIEAALRADAQRHGAQIIEGPHVIGRVSGASNGKRAAGVVAHTAGGPRVFNADRVLLATGGVLHGGLVTLPTGRVQESVFDLPVIHSTERQAWTSPHIASRQAYATFGVAVDHQMRPRALDGGPVLENLHAAGGLLAGADRTYEGSRQGIDLATAYRAVEAALS